MAGQEHYWKSEFHDTIISYSIDSYNLIKSGLAWQVNPGFSVFFSFKCEIWNPLIYILYVPKKKIMFFWCGIKKFLV
jgi:hypothetical protein